MSILVPAALAFSAIIPIILLLYFMRPRRQERVIGSTLLWQQAMQDLQASRPWQRLRITPLLLLQLLAAIAIILVLVRPAIFTSSPLSGNTIIILQASASMQATDVTSNRFENAKNTIADYIDQLGPDDHLSLITMARTPQVLIANAQDKGQLQAALQRAKVTNQEADLEQALSLAGSLAANQTGTQVLVIGDGHVLNSNQRLDTPFPVRYQEVGTDAPNVALMALSARSVDGTLTAFAQVANDSHTQRSIPVELYADGKLFGVKTVTLDPGTSGAVQWSPLNQATSMIHARLLSQDAMSIDHEAWSLVGSAAHGRVLLVTKGNMYLETALRLQSNVTLYEITPDKYPSITSNYDLTVFDNYMPPKTPTGNLLFVDPPGNNSVFGTSGPLTGVSHSSAGEDPAHLLDNVDLSSIHTMRASHQIKPAIWEHTVINTPETPLLIAGEHNGQRNAVLGFDLHDTDLPLQPAFPIMMLNMLNWFLPAPVGGNGQVSAGLPVSVQSWPGANQVTITGPDQQATTVGPPFPVIPYTKTNDVGIYQVTQHVHGQKLNGAFTVNLFSPIQSQLAPAKSLPINHSVNVATNPTLVSHQLREIWPWIAAILLLILCAEWYLFSRNYRPQSATQQRKSNSTSRDATRIRKRRPKHHRLASPFQRLDPALDALRKRTQKIKKRLRMKGKKTTVQGTSNKSAKGRA
jgi:Ca-activated chloride channel family protein